MAKFLQARTRLGTVSGQGARARRIHAGPCAGQHLDGVRRLRRQLGGRHLARSRRGRVRPCPRFSHCKHAGARPPTHAAPPGHRLGARGGRLTRTCGPPRRSKLGAWHGRWPNRQLTRPPPARHQWHRTLAAHETAATAFVHCQAVPASRISVGVARSRSREQRWGAWTCPAASGHEVGPRARRDISLGLRPRLWGVGGTPSPIATPLSPTPVGPRFLFASVSGGWG